MSIKLTSPILYAGAHVPVDGATLSYAADLEADLVNRNMAVYVSNPAQGGLVPVMASKDFTGGSRLTLTGDPIAPARPIKVLALAANAAAKVQWASGDAVLPDSWIVTVYPGGTQYTVPATQLIEKLSVSGLTNGVSYTFKVSAVIDSRVSSQSVASNAVTPTATPSGILPVVEDLEFWWAARHVASPPAGGAVYATMTDMSGNGYNAVGVSSPTWVSSWASAKPAVALNGLGQYYNTLASGLYGGQRSPEFTAYVVFDCTANPNASAATGGRVLSLERPDTTAEALAGGGFAIGVGNTAGQAGGQIYNQSSNSNAATYNAANIAVPTPPTVITVTRPGKWWVNGVVQTGMIDPQRYFGLGKPWCFGNMYANGFNRCLQGRIAEIAIFNRIHTDVEVGLMQTYLAGAY